MSDEAEDNKFFVTVKGGTEGERNAIREKFKGLSSNDEVNVDLVNVSGVEEDLSVLIKTKCGEVELSSNDLKGDGAVLESACNEVRCPVPEVPAVTPIAVTPEPEGETKTETKQVIEEEEPVGDSTGDQG